MDCICIFQACRLGERLKDYPIFSRETVSQSGTVYKSTSLKGYPTAGERLRSILLMRLYQGWCIIHMAMGCDRAKRHGNSRTNHIQGKKMFVEGDLFQVWFKFMESTQYQ